jgi:DNA-directed RNA polymerase specialized sigma24 family protein
MASSDATLVERLPRDHSGEEVRELDRRYAQQLFGFALGARGDRESAEEVVQDVFARLWRPARDYDPHRASLRTRLYAIAPTGSRTCAAAVAPCGTRRRSARTARRASTR